MRRWVLILFALLPMLSVHAQEVYEPPNAFGIVEGFWFPELTCDLNVGWERIIFDWSQHQPTGPLDWHTLNVDDRWLKAANLCDREVVALLKNTPAWATSGTPGPGVPSGLYLDVDDPNNHWANFVRQAAYYYAPRGVSRFIIWNEPDITRDTYGFEFEGDLEDYYQMVKVASIAAKQGNPDAEIHLAGTTYWHDVNAGRRLYLDRLLERIAEDPAAPEHGYYFDAISMHIYFRTDSVYEIVREKRDLLDSYGMTEQAIWVNETNAPPTQDPEWPVERPVFQYTLDQQAAFVVQSAALSMAAGAARVAVYKLYDQDLPPGGETFGLLRPDQSPRPAFDAWLTVTTHFPTVDSAALAQTDTVDVVQLTHADGRVTLVAWSRTGAPVELTVMDLSDTATMYDGLGNPLDLQRTGEQASLALPGANCNGDTREEPCPVGGPVRLLVEPDGNLTVQETTANDTIQLGFHEETIE